MTTFAGLSSRPDAQIRLCCLAAVIVSGGCATSWSVACHADERRLVSETLYFGTAKPGGRLVEGRGANGKIVEEASHVLNLVHPGDEASEYK